ncbi:MAG: ribonuclease H family protein [Lachnospiraceae bacterium]|nr:ribonuclease H family protein [Lachnospiraceae bacterium]
MAKKYYAVKQGLTPGVYDTWAECRAQVDGYSGAVYKSFPTVEEAQAFIAGESADTAKIRANDKKTTGPENTSGSVTAYVDGSYHNGTEEFSYGVVILRDGQEICYQEKQSDPELASMRNVAGEIKGAERAMRYAVEEGLDKITIVHDYEGIARWCMGEWKTNKEGTKAYKAYYDSIKNRVQITFQKVKGHSGDYYNDMADKLAKEALGIS